MKTKWLVTAGLWALGAAKAAAVPLPLMLIYGVDNRLNLYQESDPAVAKLAQGSVALFESDKVAMDAAAGAAVLKGGTYGKDQRLAPTERFYREPDGAFCSGALVGPDLVLTAGHCVQTASDCANTKLVFGYAVPKEGADSTKVPASDVYSCKNIVARMPETRLPRDFAELQTWMAARNSQADWALVRLDREAKGRAPLEVSESRPVEGLQVFLIGYPSGLPMKIAAGASVTDGSPTDYFKADLDAYAGNSGSPVFDAKTNKIVGVLVRGNKDFVEAGLLGSAVGSSGPLAILARAIESSTLGAQRAAGVTSNVSNVMPQGTKDAEQVTRVAAFKAKLDRALADRSYAAAVDPEQSAGGAAEAIFSAVLGELGRAQGPSR